MRILLSLFLFSSTSGFAEDSKVPAPFIYDPILGTSSPSDDSATITEDLVVPANGGSFTIELFANPAAIPKGDVDLIRRGSSKRGEAYAAAGVRWLSNFKQAYWGAAVRESAESKMTRWSTGHYISISRLREETLGWRHLALVYDEEALTLTVWLDQWQARTETLVAPLEFDGAPFLIGGGFDGWVNSVRLTQDVLGPDSFLRATAEPLEGVSFDRAYSRLPDDAGHLNVVRHFGAVGDGVVDDTAAIQRAMSALESHQASGEGTYVLSFPAGTYLVSDLVEWGRFLRVQGEGPEKTIIQLADRAAGFDDPENPKPVISASGVNGRPGANQAVNGSTIANWFLGFTVDTGEGNPGAVGVEFHSNNYGSFENNVIRAGDGSGAIGLDLSHKTNGPTLIADVEISGFDIGIKSRYMEYSLTLEDVTLRDQNEVAIDNRANILALNRITSLNRVPALITGAGTDLVSVLNSSFVGGTPEAAAIESGGALYARNVEVEGYGKSIAKTVVTWNPHRKPTTTIEPGTDVTGDIDVYVSDRGIHPDGKPAVPLNLPIEDAPEVAVGDIASDWLNVQEFASLVVGVGKEADWAPALEAAFAAGKPTIYFPRGPAYQVSRTVTVPPTVHRLYGMDNGVSFLGAGRADKEEPRHAERPVSLRVEGDTAEPLMIEFLSIDKFAHASPRPVRLEHARFTYNGDAGAGKVFIRDALGPWWSFMPGQQIWARQWNVESHAAGPCVLVEGATLWSLGFKTEYGSQKLRASDGAAVEILGGFIYPVVKGIPKDRPVFEILDSRFSGQWGLSQYVSQHFLQVRDVREGEVRETTVKDGWQNGPRIRMDLYSNE